MNQKRVSVITAAILCLAPVSPFNAWGESLLPRRNRYHSLPAHDLHHQRPGAAQPRDPPPHRGGVEFSQPGSLSTFPQPGPGVCSRPWIT